MGCDIHLYVERKINGEWEAVKGKNPDIEYNQLRAERAKEKGDDERAEYFEKQAKEIESGEKLKEAEDEWEKEHYSPMVLEGWAYDGRNYDLFAILADVRNGRGFAGAYTGEGFNPISEPKGLPDDISPSIKKKSDEWDCDGHSHSWLTVKELTDYDWNQVTVTLKPGLYSFNTPFEELEENTYELTYKDCVGDFYTKTLPMLKEIAKDDLESVRIVFWFDN